MIIILLNIKPIKDLTQLTTLWLDNNQIEDITPLKGLINLKELWLYNNQN